MLIPIALIVVLVSLLYYIYEKVTIKYWEAQNIPYLRPLFPFGNIQELFKDHYSEISRKVYLELKQNGAPFSVVFAFWMPYFMLTSLDFLKHLFITDIEHFYDHSEFINEEADPYSGNLMFLRGEQWKRMKAKVTPAFTPSKLKLMSPLIEEKAKNLKDTIFRMLDEKESDVIECRDLFTRYTTDVVGTYAFGIECNSLKNPDSEFRQKCTEVLNDTSAAWRLIFSTLFRRLSMLFHVKFVPKYFGDFFHRVISESVEYRETNNIQRKDLLQNLIKIRRKEQLSTKEALNAKDGKISMHEITAVSMSFLLAGFESSASILSLTMLELSKNQMLQDRARDSVRKVVQEYGKISFESLTELTFLGQCINGKTITRVWIYKHKSIN